VFYSKAVPGKRNSVVAAEYTQDWKHRIGRGKMKKAKTRKQGLTPEELQKFKALLLAKRNEILGNVSSMEDETLRKTRTDLSSMPIHMADVGTDNYEMEKTLGLMDSERKIIMEIDDALHRIEDGTYGTCDGNGEQIPKERLKAIPWARYCVDCASKMEKGPVGREERPSLAVGFEEETVEDEEEETETLDET
jgi:DnaK suppressor protein